MATGCAKAALAAIVFRLAIITIRNCRSLFDLNVHCVGVRLDEVQQMLALVFQFRLGFGGQRGEGVDVEGGGFFGAFYFPDAGYSAVY